MSLPPVICSSGILDYQVRDVTRATTSFRAQENSSACRDAKLTGRRSRPLGIVRRWRQATVSIHLLGGPGPVAVRVIPEVSWCAGLANGTNGGSVNEPVRISAVPPVEQSCRAWLPNHTIADIEE